MFFNNKLTYPLVLTVLLVAGLAFVAIPASADVIPVLSVPDELADDTNDPNTAGIQVYGIRAESVNFELTITFVDNKNTPDDKTDDINTRVTDFDDDDDLRLFAADSSNNVIPGGATASALRSNADGSVYTTTITARANISKVIIQVPDEAARTHDTFDGTTVTRGEPTGVSDGGTEEQLVVNIVRSAAPPLTISPDRSIGGNTVFTVTLTSTTAITLTRTDIKIGGGGSIHSLSSDAAKKVWTVTILPGVGVTELTVEPSANGSYIFPKGTFTVDTTGPVATITGSPPVGGGVFPVTITFDEPLQLGAALIPNEITVTGGAISALFAIPNTNSYVATLTPNPSATSVTVQVNTGAVADAGGVQNTATPSPAHTFTVAPTATTPGTTPGRGSASVTISEIMFASKGGTNDIQWIELSNGSKTQTVALNAGSGWELVIENYDDPRAANAPLSGTINFKNEGNVKTIPPEASVLIVSSNGRHSDHTHFAATRVFKVYSELPAEFGMSTRRDPFLHATKGFHIKLVDGSNNLIDEVGNLDGRIRTSDEPEWKLPNGWIGDSRSSIIRRHREYRNGRYSNKGIAQDGTEREAWIIAANTDFADYTRTTETWYGSPDDYGTPGIRAAGHPLPVQLSQFRPDLTETGTVLIQWMTESEIDNAGFNILRSQTKSGEFKVINPQMIPGAGTTAERNTYTWTDTTAKPNVVYYYQIEDVSFAGERQTLATVRLRGFISAKDKLATQWGTLKQSQN